MRKSWVVFLFCAVMLFGSFKTAVGEEKKQNKPTKEQLEVSLLVALKCLSFQDRIIKDVSSVLDVYISREKKRKDNPKKKVFEIGDVVWFNQGPVRTDGERGVPEKELNKGIYIGGEGRSVIIYAAKKFFIRPFLGLFPDKGIILLGFEKKGDDDLAEEEGKEDEEDESPAIGKGKTAI